MLLLIPTKAKQLNPNKLNRKSAVVILPFKLVFSGIIILDLEHLTRELVQQTLVQSAVNQCLTTFVNETISLASDL